MARTGHIVHNWVIGHSVLFVKTAQETGDEYLEVEYAVSKHEANSRIPLHIHTTSREQFDVLVGRMGLQTGNAVHTLNPGDSVTIQPGTPHTFWNVGADELRFHCLVTPPGRLQIYWETLFGLAEDGKVNAQGLPNLLQLAVLGEIADSYPAHVPVAVSKALLALLAALGKMKGYRARYDRYSG